MKERTGEAANVVLRSLWKLCAAACARRSLKRRTAKSHSRERSFCVIIAKIYRNCGPPSNLHKNSQN